MYEKLFMSAKFWHQDVRVNHLQKITRTFFFEKVKTWTSTWHCLLASTIEVPQNIAKDHYRNIYIFSFLQIKQYFIQDISHSCKYFDGFLYFLKSDSFGIFISFQSSRYALALRTSLYIEWFYLWIYQPWIRNHQFTRNWEMNSNILCYY